MSAPASAGLWVAGVGVVAPGLATWEAARPVLGSEQAWTAALMRVCSVRCAFRSISRAMSPDLGGTFESGGGSGWPQ